MTLRQRGHALFEHWRERYPAAACRVRNTIDLAPWYLARWRTGGAEAYDGPFWDLHSFGDWRGFAECVLAACPATHSIVDVGCGQGSALAAFAALDRGLTLRGFDNSPTGRARASVAGLRVDSLDVAALPRNGGTAFARAIGRVDLALCLEVAEHLPSWHAGKLLDVLTCASRLIFSAAHPNQGGTLHVNERPALYWIDRLGSRGFRLAGADERFRVSIGQLNLPPWYAENIHMFEAVNRVCGTKY